LRDSLPYLDKKFFLIAKSFINSLADRKPPDLFDSRGNNVIPRLKNTVLLFRNDTFLMTPLLFIINK